jgi:hypothetical protein
MAREAYRAETLRFGTVGLASLVAAFALGWCVISIARPGTISLQNVLLLVAAVSGALVVLTAVLWAAGRPPSRSWPTTTAAGTFLCLIVISSLTSGDGWLAVVPAAVIFGPPMIAWGIIWRLGDRAVRRARASNEKGRMPTAQN